jgi:hypothetical protein
MVTSKTRASTGLVEDEVCFATVGGAIALLATREDARVSISPIVGQRVKRKTFWSGVVVLVLEGAL